MLAGQFAELLDHLVVALPDVALVERARFGLGRLRRWPRPFSWPAAAERSEGWRRPARSNPRRSCLSARRGSSRIPPGPARPRPGPGPSRPSAPLLHGVAVDRAGHARVGQMLAGHDHIGLALAPEALRGATAQAPGEGVEEDHADGHHYRQRHQIFCWCLRMKSNDMPGSVQNLPARRTHRPGRIPRSVASGAAGYSGGPAAVQTTPANYLAILQPSPCRSDGQSVTGSPMLSISKTGPKVQMMKVRRPVFPY